MSTDFLSKLFKESTHRGTDQSLQGSHGIHKRSNEGQNPNYHYQSIGPPNT